MIGEPLKTWFPFVTHMQKCSHKGASSAVLILCGVPEGLVSGLTMFLLFTAHLLLIIEDHPSSCWPHPSIRDMSSVFNAGAPEKHLHLHRRCGQVDALQPAPAEYCEDQGSFYTKSTPPSATSVATPSRDQLSQANFRRAQPRHLYIDADVSMRSHITKTALPASRSCVSCGAFGV